MPVWFRRLHAKLMLGILFFIHLFQKVVFFWRRAPGLKSFLNQFVADSIYPISAEERSRFPSFQRCQTCSLCTFSCEAIQTGKAPISFEPKMLMLGFGRSSHEAEYLTEAWIPCAECAACTVLCPNAVPVHRMAQQIIERRKNVSFRS